MRTFFVPLLAGATLGDRVVASAGAVIGIIATTLITTCVLGSGPLALLLVAPMGASAVLVFAVPASPLAQPWPVVGGNVISAFVGMLAASLVSSPALAAGVAVGGAILVMSLLRCLHPPGGAAALTAVIGGPAVASAGWLFPIVPVGINAVLLAVTGILFHRLTRHSYPHRPVAPPIAAEPHPEDLDAALAELGETFDIGRDDLDRLFESVRRHSARRRNAG